MSMHLDAGDPWVKRGYGQASIEPGERPAVLTIDLQYEDPTIAIAPELATEAAGDQLAGEFAFDPPALDQLFAELTPAEPASNGHAAAGDALDLARDYIAKGLLDLL